LRYFNFKKSNTPPPLGRGGARRAEGLELKYKKKPPPNLPLEYKMEGMYLLDGINLCL